LTDPRISRAPRTTAESFVADGEQHTGPLNGAAGTGNPAPDGPDALGEELRQKVQRQAERVQQTAAGVQTEAQRRVETVQQRASKLRTQLEFRREKRDPIRYRLSISTAKLLARFASVLPGPVRVRLAILIGWIIFRFNSGFRDNVRDNLHHVLGPDATEERIDATSRSIARNGILNILDLLIMYRRGPAEVLALMDLDPAFVRHLDGKGREPGGTIVVTAHLGSFDMIGQAIGVMGCPLTILTGRTTYRALFDAVSFLRSTKGGRIVEPSPSGVRGIYRSLRRGEVVGIVCDRDFFFNGIPVRFFGAQTTLPPGPVRIARDTGAMLLPTFARRNGDRHEIRVQPAFEVPRTDDVEADVAAGMAFLVAALEREIGAEPEQWSIFQRVWPDLAPVTASGS